MKNCGSSSVGRASASQAEGREFESRLPLDENETRTRDPQLGKLMLYQAEGREFESRLPLDENGLLNIQETVFRFCYFFILTS